MVERKHSSSSSSSSVASRLKSALLDSKSHLFKRSISMTTESAFNYQDDDVFALPRMSSVDIVQPRMSSVDIVPARTSSATPPRMSFTMEYQNYMSPGLMKDIQDNRSLSYSSETETEPAEPEPEPEPEPAERGEAYIDIRFKCVSEMQKNGSYIFSLAAADGILYTGSECNFIRSWKFAGENVVESGRLHSWSGTVRAMLLIEDKLFSAHADHKIRVWRRSGSSPGAGHKRTATIPTLLDSIHRWMKPKRDVIGSGSGRRQNPKSHVKHMGAICCLAYTDGFLYSGSSDKTVKVWRVSDLKCVETIQAHDDAVNAIAVGPNGLIYSGSDDCTVKIWRKNLGQSPHVLLTTLRGINKSKISNSNTNSPVKALALNSDGSALYTGCSNGDIIWWEKEQYSSSQMREAGILRGHVRAVLCLATVGGNYNLLISGSVDGTIRVWSRGWLDSDKHTCSAVIKAHSGPVRCIAAILEEENRVLLFSGSLDGSFKMWHLCIKHGRSRPASLYHKQQISTVLV